MWALFDQWQFLAGLGMFLFGMYMLEETVRLLAGRSLRSLIRRATGTRLKGLMVGVTTTAVLQSSSAVSLMVLAFVGAGLMSLANAVAVILGTNIGTTCTAWIVALAGFELKIDAFALPMIGIGGVGLIFLAGSHRARNLCKLLISFGFLFHGLDYIKGSVESFAAAIDLARVPAIGPWAYAGVGLLVTAVIQSSSATLAIALTALSSGIIDFPQAAAVVIGANIGTTVTVLIGAIGGIPAKKQTAASSLVFNTATALAVVPLLPLFFHLINNQFGLADRPVLGIALFHTLFNLFGVLLFLPLIPALVRLLRRLFPERRAILTRYLHNATPQVAEAALAALTNEVRHQLLLSIRAIGARYGLRPVPGTPAAEGLPTAGRRTPRPPTYDDLERLHAELFTFSARIETQEPDPREAVLLDGVLRASRSIMNATRTLHLLQPEAEEIDREENPLLVKAHGTFRERMRQLWAAVEELAADPQAEPLEEALPRHLALLEEADQAFIRACSASVARLLVHEEEVTQLLMINRFFNQSSRMLLLSLQGLPAVNGTAAAPAESPAPTSPETVAL